MSQRVFAIFFLTVYSLVLFQPVMPWINYSLNKEYIAKNLCENRKKPGSHCNGKCYLAKQLKKAGDNAPLGTSSSQKNSSEETIVHLVNSFDAGFVVSSTGSSFVDYAPHYKPLTYEDGIEHPPCV
jgi:hypothetical protein